MPSNPAANAAAKTRYGFATPSGVRVSTRMLHLPPDEVACERREAVGSPRVVKQVGAGGRIGQAEVEVITAAAEVGARLGHERSHQAVLPGDLFDRLLEEEGAVGHVQRLAVVEVNLELARKKLMGHG